MAGAAAKRHFRIPPKTLVSLVWNVHGPSIPSKTRPILNSEIAASQAVTDVSYDVQFLMKGAHSRGDRRNSSGGYSASAWSSLAGDPPDRQRRAGGVCHGRCRLFSGALRPPVDERLGSPANTGYPQSL